MLASQEFKIALFADAFPACPIRGEPFDTQRVCMEVFLKKKNPLQPPDE